MTKPKEKHVIFARLLFKELEKEYWGDIEPEIFSNVAHQALDEKHPDFVANKLDDEDAVDAAKSMDAILRRIFQMKEMQ